LASFDHANSGFENIRDEQEERGLLRAAALALNALGTSDSLGRCS